MKRNIWIGIIISLIILIAGGIWLYNWVLGEPLGASEPISAIPVEVETQSPTPTPEPINTPIVEVEATPTGVPAADDGLVILSIVPEESEARFSIYELLNGQDKTVIGKTNQIAGEVAINPDDLSQVQLGPIQVNARTFATDDDRRNNAIRNRILLTNQYEYVTFTPTAISGLQGSGAVGQTYTFQVSGDLTIREITKPVTFEITLQAESDARISGFASTTINRSDFEIVIPSVPFVANVGDEITIELDFVLVPTNR